MRYDLRSAICRIGSAMHAAGLIAGRAGNISVRVDADTILITPRGTRKDTLRPTDLLVVRLGDVNPPARASTELPLHRAAYLADIGVSAVLHAHPPALTAAGLRRIDLVTYLPELGEAIGPIAPIEFAPSGSEQLGRAVKMAVVGRAAVMLLHGHGAVSVGADLDEAFDRLELAESSAHAVLLARG